MLLNKNSFNYFLLLASGLSALYFLYFPEECSGYAGIYTFLISAAAFVTFFLLNAARLLFIRPVNGFVHKVIPFLILAALLVFNRAIPGLIHHKITGNKILVAWTSACKCGDLSTLTLMDNGYYEIKMTETEFVCRYTGEYNINGDTLLLRKDLVVKTDSTYSSSYLIDMQDSILRPIINGSPDHGSNHLLILSMLDLKSTFQGRITSR